MERYLRNSNACPRLTRTPGLSRFGLSALAALAASFGALAAGDAGGAPAATPNPALTRPALEQTFNPMVALQFGTQPDISYTTLQALKPGLPEDEAKAGWEQLLANDFKQARTSFEKVLGMKPGQASAVTGLMFLNALEGHDEESAEIGLARIRAAANSPAGLLALNELNDWSGAPLDTSLRLDKLMLELIDNKDTDAGLRTILSASLSSHPRNHMPVTSAIADRLFAQSGIVPSYQLTFGPFGLYYGDLSGNAQAQSLLARPFAPEAGLGNLQFQDTPPLPAPVLPPRDTAWPRITIKNPDTIYGTLSIDDQMPSYDHTAIFYTLTNLDSPQETDAIVMLEGLDSAVTFLNGLPIWTPEAGRNRAPHLYMLGHRALLKVRLQKGHNTFLIKHSASESSFSIRVLGSDWLPIQGLAYAALTDDEIAKVRVYPLRGRIAAEPVLSYDMAWLVGSKDGKQTRMGLGDLTAVAQTADVARLPLFARLFLDRSDYLSALALTESLRKTWPQSVYAQWLEAAFQRRVVQSRMAADGRFGVTARTTLEALAKKYPTLFLLRKAELEIAEERSDPEKTLTLARQLTADFPAVAQSHYLLAQVYQKRKWQPENEAEIGSFLELYSAGNGGGGEGYTARVQADAHRYASNYYERDGRQATYLKLAGEAHKAGLDSPQDWARHLFDIGQTAEGLKVLQDDLEAWPKYRRELTGAVARYQRRLGNWDAYRTWLDQVLERNPYDAGVLNERIMNSVRQGFTKEALADLDLYAQRFGPTEALTRLQLDLKQEDPLAWYKPYDLADDAVDPKEFTNAKYQSADTANLIDLTVIKFLPDTSAWQYTKEVSAPLVTNAVDEVSKQRTGDLKDVLEIRSHNADGKGYIPEYMTPGTAEMYNVEVGSRVSTNHLVFRAANAERPGVSVSHRFLAVDDPVGIERVVVILPAALDAKTKLWMNLPAQVKHTRTEANGDVVHVFENTTHDPLKNERAMPTEDLMPEILLYTDDGDLAHNGGALRTAQPFYPSQLVAETATAILKTLPETATREQQLDAIINWARTELKPGQGADNFDDMIAMKTAGDRPGRLDLVQALAQAVRLPVRDVMSISGDNPYRSIPPKATRFVYQPGSLMQVGATGMLALETERGETIFRTLNGQQAELYPTLPAVDANLMSASELFNYIALARPLGQTPVRYEGVRPVSSTLHIQIRVAVQADNTGVITGRAFLYGRFAGQIREQRTDAQNRQKLDNNLVQWFWPHLDSQSLEYIDDTDPNSALEVALLGKVGRLGQTDPAQPAAGISIPALMAPGRNSLSAIIQLIDKTEREYDFLMRGHLDSTQNVMYPAVLVYEAPAGWCWSEVPEDLVLDTEFGWYFCNYQVFGSRLEIHRGYMLPKQRQTPEQWKKFCAFLGAVRNYETLGKIVCRPLPPSAPFATDTLSSGPVRTDFGW
ncbi:MAG TPA: hypothetical protein VL860_06840 [Planctomycetota bacterium]|nr:hypothetical protein [Planctomycetota bacterium]